jgi:nitroimidazol reductase NimA-like FMN-containing flavoprotein (pyridoxamine 5'-phosphate oxidase superfamily)
MSISNNLDKLTKMRREDRAVEDDSRIRQFLAEAPYGMLATDCEGQPMLHVNTFVYDESTHSLYMHTARQGRTRTNIDSSPSVCFSAAKMGRLLPAKAAREFSVEYESVTVFGKALIVNDRKQARDKMQLLLDKYFGHLKPERDYCPITAAEIDEITVIQIQIRAWTGKCKKVEDDFPGAFFFGENPRD